MSVSVRRLTLSVLAWSCAVVVCLAGALPAQAAVEHKFEFSFDGNETPAGSFGSVDGVAVDQSTADVYVADVGNDVVDKFDAQGKYLCQVTGSSLPSLSECNGAAGSQTPEGSLALTSPAALAVDNSVGAGDPNVGDLYVLDGGHGVCSSGEGVCGVVDRFGQEGAYLGQVGGPFASPVVGVAIGASGDVWVHEKSGLSSEFSPAGEPVFAFEDAAARRRGFAVGGEVFAARAAGVERFSASGEPLGELEECGFCAVAVAVDQSTDDVYVDYARAEEPRVGEYNAAGEPVARFAQTQLGGGASEEGGVAVDPVTGTVFLASALVGKVFVFAPSPGPRVRLLAATGVSATGATVHATVNPEGSATSYQFEYGTSTEYGQSAALSAQSAGSGQVPVPVSAELGELEGGTVYHYRVSAIDSAGDTTRSADGTFTTLPVPRIDSATVSNLSASSADLHAKIAPESLDTRYRFEYGLSAGYGHSVPAPDQDIGSGETDVFVTQHISGLEADRTYHWRVVATGPNGTTTSVDHTFVYPTAGAVLPDNRAYEMVTPPHKNGALISDLFIAGTPPSISADGTRLIASAIQCFADAESCPAERTTVGSSYEFTRTGSGWHVSALAPSAQQFPISTSYGYSADLRTALFMIPTPGPQDDIYVRKPDGSLTDVGPITPPADGALGSIALNGIITSADLSRTVFPFQGEGHWPFDATGGGGVTLYEYLGFHNSQPLLVGVSGGQGSTSLISACGTSIPASSGALSTDGNVVYFYASGTEERPAEPCVGSGENSSSTVPVEELFARIDNGLPDARTVAIFDPSPSACGQGGESGEVACREAASSPTPAYFEGASLDGSKAFFTSTKQLTDTASEDKKPSDVAKRGGCAFTTGISGCNLYEYENVRGGSAEHRLIDISVGDSSGRGPRVRGVLALSPDGSHVYFVAQGVLSGAPNAQGQVARDGANNLYVYERDSAHPAGALTFIAALPQTDEAEWSQQPDLPANVTPDGRFLVFPSHGRLTSDDTSLSGATQIFRYDAQSDQLVRVSIGDSGFNDNGNRSGPTPCASNQCSENANIAFYSGGTFAGTARLDPSMSDDGSYVFFQSPVGLTPQALDDVQINTQEGVPVYAQNVYEWHEGRVYLISDGRDVSANRGASTACPTFSSVCLLGADASGSNVFFATADQLVAQDTDGELDYYDARICTEASPCIKSPPPPLPPCLGEACHGTPAGTPALLTAPTATFAGQGNLSPAMARIVTAKHSKRRVACPRSKRRHGKRPARRRCVKRVSGRAGHSSAMAGKSGSHKAHKGGK